MGTAIIQVKIMPESPETDLDEITKKAEEIILKDSKNSRTEREPIAFGLFAIKITFIWPEEASTDEILDKLRSISGVSSAEIIDFRRAIG